MTGAGTAWTPGPWSMDFDDFHEVIEITAPSRKGHVPIAKIGVGYIFDAAQRANAALIIEAGTVATETGMTPRQLAERANDFFLALQNIIDLDQHYVDTARTATKDGPIAKYARTVIDRRPFNPSLAERDCRSARCHRPRGDSLMRQIQYHDFIMRLATLDGCRQVIRAQDIKAAASLLKLGYARAEDSHDGPEIYLTDFGRKYIARAEARATGGG